MIKWQERGDPTRSLGFCQFDRGPTRPTAIWVASISATPSDSNIARSLSRVLIRTAFFMDRIHGHFLFLAPRFHETKGGSLDIKCRLESSTNEGGTSLRMADHLIYCF